MIYMCAYDSGTFTHKFYIMCAQFEYPSLTHQIQLYGVAFHVELLKEILHLPTATMWHRKDVK